MINLQELIVFSPFFISVFSLIIVILSISYSRNHFFTALFVVSSLTSMLFSLFFLTSKVPLNVANLFYVDGYSILYISMIIIASICTCIFAYPSLKQYLYNKEEFYLLILIANLGSILSIISNNMSSLFMSIEITSIPMFGLIAYFNNKKYSLEAAFKYVILSSVASSFLLFGIAWVYSISGDLNFTSINHILNIISFNEKLVILFGIIMILISLFFKLSIVPFHLWTPDVYEGTPSVVLSFFSTVGKIATFVILLHVLSHVSNINNILYFLLSLMTIFSMLIGNLMALFQNNLKRFFGYSSISQLAYLFIVLLVSKDNYALSLEASSIYLFSYLFSNVAYFGIINLISNVHHDKDVDSISSYKGFFWSDPILSSILTVILLSLSGFPMTVGFIGKFYILSIVLKEHLWIVGISFLISTILGFFCYLKIIINLYCDLSSTSSLKKFNTLKNNWLYTPTGLVIFFAGMILLIFGVYPNPLINFITLISCL